MKKSVVSVQDLCKIYPGKEAVCAVDRISFQLREGEILGFLGPNGSGKTTTIQMLLGTLSKTSGKIFYFGKEFETHREEILEKVSFASTYLSLPYLLTVEENLDVIGLLYGITRKESRKRYMPLLERFGMKEYAKRSVASLSAGQTTRLTIVKAFFMDPQVVLLDEPTASLDPDISGAICEFLLERRDATGLSILFTSHKMGEVATVCDRVIFLNCGKVVADDLPEELAKRHAAFRLSLVFAEGLERATALAFERKFVHRVEHRSLEIELSEKEISQFLHLLGKEGIIYSSIQIKEPSLEDYFLTLAKSKK